ncbi:DUF5677 domain-containing protein [Streptomyces angustmyceticus]|uniref:Uncharacterized protein n=1 Tax=Streptomyces angustmyceticus TaxID=285578 RepID=A0A5J4LPE9_9ACTN|nr:DUF5677 domain-containing protein [Streptomyces angustmyceticus]UAL68758.1 DUF5677 domain-containing protein [Streptomyces angustmyceticus]GES32328.1 hypothetical protein San01_48150 [Streptomyces angustmyceticus]
MASSEERNVADAGSSKRAGGSQDPRKRPLFDVVAEITAVAEQAADAAADADNTAIHLDGYVLRRGIKGLKSAQLLVDAGHWEYATPVARQLFELLVNMEHLGSFADRREAQRIYSNFGLLQYFLAESRRIEFEKTRGRPSGSPWELSVKDFLDRCTDFRMAPRADGTVRWRTSWSGKTTRALAESSPDPMRVPQYELLFSTWSEQTHGAPGVLATDLFLRYEEEIVAEALAEVKGVPPELPQLITGSGLKGMQTLSMAIILFLHLWQQLPNVPQPDLGECSKWLGITKAFTGGKGIPIAD